MTVNAIIQRPLTTLTEQETNAVAAVASDNDESFAIDFKATIATNARLIGRTRITIETSGNLQRYRFEFLDYSSSADQTYADGDRTTPFSDAEADNAASIAVIGYSPWIDMDAIHKTAGDATAS